MANKIRQVNNARIYTQDRVRVTLDTSRFVFGETPTPAVDGAQTVFTVANAYVAGTLQVYRGSLVMHPTTDFSETTDTTFTMVTAPDSDEPLIVSYIKK